MFLLDFVAVFYFALLKLIAWLFFYGFSCDLLFLNFFVSCSYYLSHAHILLSLWAFLFFFVKIRFSQLKNTHQLKYIHIYLQRQTDSHSWIHSGLNDFRWNTTLKTLKNWISLLSALPLQILCHWIAHDSCGVCVSHSFLM